MSSITFITTLCKHLIMTLFKYSNMSMPKSLKTKLHYKRSLSQIGRNLKFPTCLPGRPLYSPNHTWTSKHIPAVKSNTGWESFCWIGIQYAMPYSQKYTPPHCFYCNFAGWVVSLPIRIGSSPGNILELLNRSGTIPSMILSEASVTVRD